MFVLSSHRYGGYYVAVRGYEFIFECCVKHNFLFTFETCYWLIILVTMMTPISSDLKVKIIVSSLRAMKIWFLLAKGKILVFYQYLYNKAFYYIDTEEIPGFLLLLKSHFFTARSEDIIFLFHMWRYWCRHGY